MGSFGYPELFINTFVSSTARYPHSTGDVDHGTYIINTPGRYKLCEDNTFNPNPPIGTQTAAEAFDPDFPSTTPTRLHSDSLAPLLLRLMVSRLI